MAEATHYDADFFAWANEQAVLLRAGRFAILDVENIAEELETLGRSEKRELISRLRVLLHHLLKWQFQPERCSNSWRLSIANVRDELDIHLHDNPSLRSRLDEALTTAYRLARRDAAADTELAEATFPADCPWSVNLIMDDGFWPGA